MKSSVRSEKAVNSAASKWRSGTQHYLERFKPIAEEIHQKAKSMPHNGIDDAEAIVEMTVNRLREFADAYHTQDE